MSRVVCVGLCTVDHLGVVSRYPELDHKEQMETFSIQGGGPAATAAAQLAMLDVDVSFVGKISDDSFGRFARASLEELEIDCSGLIHQPDRISPMSFVAVHRETGRRTIFWTGGSISPLLAEDVDLSVLDGADLLLMDGHQPDGQLALALEARKRGIPVLLDAGSHRDGMEELVKVSTAVVASERYSADLGGSADRALTAIADLGPQTVVITLGEDGSVGREGDRAEVVAPYPVEVVDTTGAGDVYHGAFAYGLLQGWKLRARMEFAGCAASLKCRELGGRAALPGLDEIEAALDG